jgi:hypothetical protein
VKRPGRCKISNETGSQSSRLRSDWEVGKLEMLDNVRAFKRFSYDEK